MFLYHKIIVNSNQEPSGTFWLSCVLPSLIYSSWQSRIYRIHAVVSFSLGPSLEILFVVRFSVVVSVVLLSPFSISSLFNKQTCFITFFRRRRRFAVSQFFVSKTVPNNVEGLISHWHFNSVAYKVTRHTANIISYIHIYIYLFKYFFILNQKHSICPDVISVCLLMQDVNEQSKHQFSTSKFVGLSSLPFQLPTGWLLFRGTQF